MYKEHFLYNYGIYQLHVNQPHFSTKFLSVSIAYIPNLQTQRHIFGQRKVDFLIT